VIKPEQISLTNTEKLETYSRVMNAIRRYNSSLIHYGEKPIQFNEQRKSILNKYNIMQEKSIGLHPSMQSMQSIHINTAHNETSA